MRETTFVNKLRRVLTREGYRTKREVSTGYGIADLVAIRSDRFAKRRVELRLQYGQRSKLLLESYFKVLAQIPDINEKRSPVSLNSIKETTHFTRSFLKYELLRTLKRRGYIREVASEHFVKLNGWMPLASEVIAIEAKMKDWRRGLLQANRYKAFANKVYLAIPTEISHLVDRTLFKQLNVGLIVFDALTNRKTISLRCKCEKPWEEHKNNLAIEQFWDRNTLGFLSLL